MDINISVTGTFLRGVMITNYSTPKIYCKYNFHKIPMY